MTILQASFYWKNNEPGGLGISFTPPGFALNDLQTMFGGRIAKEYMRNSDLALGTQIVNDMLVQLSSVGQMKLLGEPIPTETAILAALNIMWLSSRGFIPNDEFNGVQFVYELSGMQAMPPKFGDSA